MPVVVRAPTSCDSRSMVPHQPHRKWRDAPSVRGADGVRSGGERRVERTGSTMANFSPVGSGHSVISTTQFDHRVWHGPYENRCEFTESRFGAPIPNPYTTQKRRCSKDLRFCYPESLRTTGRPESGPRPDRFDHRSSTALTRRCSASVVNGFCRKSTPGFSWPWCTIASSV
jgi:hypothetical protein